MRISFEVARSKAASSVMTPLSPRGAWRTIWESFSGAWQRNVEVKLDDVLSNPTVFRCQNLISSDVAKMHMRIVEKDNEGIWNEVIDERSELLARPNQYQNRIQFMESWVLSKLSHGNTYVLLVKNRKRNVIAMFVLDPLRVKVLVAPDGSVFYELQQDELSSLSQISVRVPASEIIHDRWNTIYHPLIGVSPIHAHGVAATQGLRIIESSTKFFANGAVPRGILMAPEAIDEEDAKEIKANWEKGFSGENAGKTAVLGDGMKYTQLSMSAVDAQLIDQLKWSGETICSTYGVPAYMAGIGPAPLNNNVEALQQQYYSQCLQIHLESIELCLDIGLEFKEGRGTEFDLDDLLRMDTATLVKTEVEAVKGGVKTPNEARKRINLKPLEGGNSIYMQQQQYSLEALAKRDAGEDPFGKANPTPVTPAVVDEPDPDETEKFIAAINAKSAEIFNHA